VTTTELVERPAGYEPPRVELIVDAARLERESLYAGQQSQPV